MASSQNITIVLGAFTTKAVHVELRDGKFRLLNYSLHPTPEPKKPWNRDGLTDLFKAIKEAMGTKVKDTALVVGMTQSVLRHVSLPKMAPSEMRRLMRLNSRSYFQEDLPGFVFDCTLCGDMKPLDSNERASGHRTVLVGGAKAEFLNDLQVAARRADLIPTDISLTQIGLANVAARSLSAEIKDEAIALVDLGFGASTISIMAGGELRLTRVVDIGGDRLTAELAQLFTITYEVAEGIKLVMPDKAIAKLHGQISSLGSQLRAAIDFFEHSQEKPVSRILISGGAARCDHLIDALAVELKAPCSTWDTAEFLELALPDERMRTVKKDFPQLVAAIGGAVSALDPGKLNLDLMADEKELQEIARRDPVRRAVIISACLLTILLLWAIGLKIEAYSLDRKARRYEAEVSGQVKVREEITKNLKSAGDLEKNFNDLKQWGENRFFWAVPLSALREAATNKIQFMRISIDQDVASSTVAVGRSKRPASIEKMTMTLHAKNFGDVSAREQFIERLASLPYFKSVLRKDDPILLKSNLPRQVDPNDPSKSFSVFSIECVYAERVIGYE